MGWEDSEGVIVAEITPGPSGGALLPVPDRFWIPDMPQPMLDAWETQSQQGVAYYREVTLPHRQAGNHSLYPMG